jgi:hypothetical protein
MKNIIGNIVQTKFVLILRVIHRKNLLVFFIYFKIRVSLI